MLFTVFLIEFIGQGHSYTTVPILDKSNALYFILIYIFLHINIIIINLISANSQYYV